MRSHPCETCGRQTRCARLCAACSKALSVTGRPVITKPCETCRGPIPYGRWCPSCYANRKAAGLPLGASQR